MEPPQRTLSEEVESLAAALAAIRIAPGAGDAIVDALPPALFIAKYFPQSASAEVVSRFIGGFCFAAVGFCALLQAIQLPTDFGSYMVAAVLPLQSVFTYFTDGFRLWYIWAGLLLLVLVIVRTHLDMYVDRVYRT